MNKPKRRILLIDRPIQISLVFRLFIHWLALLFTVACLLPFCRVIILGDVSSTPLTQRITEFGVDALILFGIFVLLLPAFAYDSLRLTNRFAGPMYRLHQTMRKVGPDTPFEPIRLRKGDFWHDVADDFNKMVQRLQRPENEHSEAEQEEAASV